MTRLPSANLRLPASGTVRAGRVRAGAARNSWVLPTIVLVFASLAAAVMGLVAVTANPIIVAMGAACIFGPMLLLRPGWIVWMVIGLGLTVVGLVGLWAEGIGTKAAWGLSALSFLLLLLALFRAVTQPDVRRGSPAFVWLALAFIAFAMINGLAQSASVYEFAGGMKRYFQGMGVMFALAWLGFGETDMRRWKKFLLFVALIQLPFAVYELIHFVPIRQALQQAYPLMVPIDVVAGTFGSTLTAGGGSGSMAIFLIIVLGFFLTHFRENLLSARKLALIAPVVIAPLLISETKIVVVIVPMLFLGLYWREIVSRPHIGLAGLIVGALVTVAAGFAYLKMSKNLTLEQRIDNTLAYNIGDRGVGGQVLNRTSALIFWARQQGLHDPVSAVAGNGIGASHEVTGGHLAVRYAGYGIGLTAVSTLLWDQGLFGTALYLSILLSAWFAALRVRKHAKEPWVRADAAAIAAALPIQMLALMYNRSPLEGMAYQIFSSALLGYLAWLYKRQAVSPTRTAK